MRYENHECVDVILLRHLFTFFKKVNENQKKKPKLTKKKTVSE